MGSLSGSGDSNPFPGDINAILRDILGYEPAENDFGCLLPSPDDGEVGDNFRLFDLMLDHPDPEKNLCCDLQSVNLNVPSNQWMEDNLINGDAQNYFSNSSPLSLDGAAFVTAYLQMSLFPSPRANAENASFDPIVEDPEKQCGLDSEATDAGKTESSELKKIGVGLFGEAAGKEKDVLDAKDATEKEALNLNDALTKLKRKAPLPKIEFEPRKKSCYKNKGIRLRLSRLKSGN